MDEDSDILQKILKKQIIRFSKISSKEIEIWLDKSNVNTWRHLRMWQSIDSIISENPNSSWLTIGDGRYGMDAKYLKDKGAEVLATDITGNRLKEAKDRGLIDKFGVENAEDLSFKNSEFDFVFCKESYHHFSRPMIALYEMLRVASKAVILIEPNDSYYYSNVLEILFRKSINLFKIISGRKISKHNFEEAGNYIFAISERELEKVAVGMNLSKVAFKGLSDYYQEGLGNEKISLRNKAYLKVKLMIVVLNLLAILKLRPYRMLIAILFKHEPTNILRKRLRKNGYKIVDLPENPHFNL